jgi:hypothetical protein
MTPHEEKSSFLPSALILRAGCALFFALKWSRFGENDSSKSISVEDTDRLVNKHLQETNEAIEAQKLRRSVENDFSIPKVGELVPFHGASTKSLDLDAPEDRNQQEMREAFDDSEKGESDSTPRSQIESQLADKQRLEAYDREYKEKYIKQFVENAHTNGWKLVVDKNGLVQSAQRIEPTGSSTNVFHPSLPPSAESE